MKKLVIFDLDGTLLDTIGDLAAACDYMLKRLNLPAHTKDEYRMFVGNGITRLVERSLPESLRDPGYVANAREIFREYYQAHIDLETLPYPGIPELLDELANRGVKVAVASNKYDAGTKKLISSFFSSVHFSAVFGQREGIPPKPDPQVVWDILEIAGTAASEVLYVGDSGVDVTTARNAGIESIGVTWGFRSREELEESGASHIVDAPDRIPDYL